MIKAKVRKLRDGIEARYNSILASQKRKLLEDLILTEEKVGNAHRQIIKTRRFLGIPDGVPTSEWKINQTIH